MSKMHSMLAREKVCGICVALIIQDPGFAKIRKTICSKAPKKHIFLNYGIPLGVALFISFVLSASPEFFLVRVGQ